MHLRINNNATLHKASSSLSSVYLLIANGMPLSYRKKCVRSPRKRRRAKCKMACVALKNSPPSREIERAHERHIYFISFDMVGVCARGFLKQRHRPLWFMSRLPHSFLIPRSYVNNLSCNRPGESKTNGTAFGKLLARKTYWGFYFCFKNGAISFIYQCPIRDCHSRYPLWFIIIPRRMASIRGYSTNLEMESFRSYVKDIRITLRYEAVNVMEIISWQISISIESIENCCINIIWSMLSNTHELNGEFKIIFIYELIFIYKNC